MLTRRVFLRGSEEHPLTMTSAAVVEIRRRATLQRETGHLVAVVAMIDRRHRSLVQLNGHSRQSSLRRQTAPRVKDSRLVAVAYRMADGTVVGQTFTKGLVATAVVG